MNRRGFFAVLAAIPFVGKLFRAEPEPWVPFSVRYGYRKPGEPYRWEPKTTLPEVKWRDPEGDMEKMLAKISVGHSVERVELTCLTCSYSTPIYVPSGTFRSRTRILKTQKFVCVDCTMKKLED